MASSAARARADTAAMYLRSVYFAITVLSTVGYDIRPRATSESLFMIINVVRGDQLRSIGLLTAYIVSSADPRGAYQQRVKRVLRYMSARFVSKDLQKRTEAYYAFKASHSAPSPSRTWSPTCRTTCASSCCT